MAGPEAQAPTSTDSRETGLSLQAVLGSQPVGGFHCHRMPHNFTLKEETPWDSDLELLGLYSRG
jgi:hypothetical protein